MNRIAQRWMQRPWFAALLLIALLFRALVPIGYMLGADADHHFAVVLCPAYDSHPHADMPGMEHMPGMLHHLDPVQHDARHNVDSSCPFAVAIAGMALVQLAPVTLSAERLHSVSFFPPDQFIPRGTIVPTRLPRGPPGYA
jgi:hypothetical protein